MTAKQQILFGQVAASMGMEESAARISLATPVVNDDVLQYRAFCIAELLVGRLIDSGELLQVTRQTWGEVKHCIIFSKEKVVALVQFSGSPQTFPLEIPFEVLVGHKDAIVQRVRELDRGLLSRLTAWNDVTKNGLLQFSSSQVLMKKMDNYLNHKAG